MYGFFVALYLLSSPNHNSGGVSLIAFRLRYIFFHHQTTTALIYMLKNISLRYIFFHHQTTTPSLHWPQGKGCVISSFITKPQPVLYRHSLLQVALYLLSSPNHNFTSGASSRCKVALYLLSSPNHNGTRIIFSSRMVALYLLSSPNHNDWYKHFPVMELRYIFFHHQTTTLPT